MDLYQKIYAQNPSLVLSLEFNLPAASFYIPMDYNQAIDPIFDAKKLIIESALTDPQPALSQNDKNRAQIILQRIMMRLSSNYGDNVVSTTFKHPGDPNLDQKIAAEIIIQFYQMILDRGKDDAGLVIKYIFTTANYQS